VVQNVPLLGGLCLTVDFDQIWSKHVPLVGELSSNKCGPNMCPLTEDFVFATEFDHIWINNVLIIKKGWYQTNRSLSINQRGTETAISNFVAI
jgi:hypothetical protein